MCLAIFKHRDHLKIPMPVGATEKLVRRSRNFNPLDLYSSVSEQSNRYSKVRVPTNIYSEDILVAMSIHRDSRLQENLSGDRVLGVTTFAKINIP